MHHPLDRVSLSPLSQGSTTNSVEGELPRLPFVVVCSDHVNHYYVKQVEYSTESRVDWNQNIYRTIVIILFCIRTYLVQDLTPSFGHVMRIRVIHCSRCVLDNVPATPRLRPARWQWAKTCTSWRLQPQSPHPCVLSQNRQKWFRTPMVSSKLYGYTCVECHVQQAFLLSSSTTFNFFL